MNTAAEARFLPPTQKHPVVRFSHEEIEYLWDVAKARFRTKRPTGNRDTYDGGKSILTVQFEAAKAEYAVCKALGAQLDTTVSPKGQPLGNIILPDGRRGNARYRGNRGGDYALKNNRLEAFLGDVGFLVWPEKFNCAGCAVQVMGFITRERFVTLASETEFSPERIRLTVPHVLMKPLTEVYQHDRIDPQETSQAALF